MQLAMPQNQKAKTRRPSVVRKEEHVGSQFFPQPTAMFFFYLRISRTAELSEIPVAASETGQWFMIYLLAAAGAWASFLLRRTGRQSGEGKEPAIVVPESWQEFQTTRVIQTLPVNAGRRRVRLHELSAAQGLGYLLQARCNWALLRADGFLRQAECGIRQQVR